MGVLLANVGVVAAFDWYPDLGRAPVEGYGVEEPSRKTKLLVAIAVKSRRRGVEIGLAEKIAVGAVAVSRCCQGEKELIGNHGEIGCCDGETGWG